MRCLNPVRLWFYDVTVPCGKCGPCRMSRATEWATRLVHELEYEHRGVFATLTYEVPPQSLSVSKRELQLFLKRLRRFYTLPELSGGISNPWCDPNRKIKYYACGEYGENHGLPHYHLILLGVDLAEHVLEGAHYVVDGPLKRAWCRESVPMEEWAARGCPGYIYVGTVTPSSVRYVTDYVQKGKLVARPPGSEPAFQLCSQGIGKRYALDNREQLVSDGTCRIDGVVRGLPRYYQKLLAEPSEIGVLQPCLTAELRAERAIERQAQVLEETGAIRDVDGKMAVRRRFFQRVFRDESLREVAIKSLEGWSAQQLQDDERVHAAVRRAVAQSWRNRQGKERIKAGASPF